MDSSANNKLKLGIALVVVAVGLLTAILGDTSLKLIILATVGILITTCFFVKFDNFVLGLLIVRSSLDLFDKQQIPAVFAICLDALVLIYVITQLLTGKPVYTDRFWWFLLFWGILQSLWVMLVPLGVLGLDVEFFSIGLREWVRQFSFVMVYLLVMQLKDKISPEEFINKLFLALILPLAVAAIQLILPPSLLPSLITPTTGLLEGTSRISGTFAHSASFAKFVFLFISITYWKVGHAQRRWPWILLLIALVFFLTTTKSLTTLSMTVVFLLVVIIPSLKFQTLLGGVSVLLILIALFTSTEYGQERIRSVSETPLLNPDITISRSILMQEQGDESNSFNWRIKHWNDLLRDWQKAPMLGNGLGTSAYLGEDERIAHNDYVSSLVETGMLGLVIFISFIGVQFTYLIQLILSSSAGSSKRKFCIVLLAVLTSWLVGMATDNIWRVTNVIFYWWAFVAIAGWDWENSQSQKISISR